MTFLALYLAGGAGYALGLVTRAGGAAVVRENAGSWGNAGLACGLVVLIWPALAIGAVRRRLLGPDPERRGGRPS